MRNALPSRTTDSLVAHGITESTELKLEALKLGPTADPMRTWGGIAGKEARLSVITQNGYTVEFYTEESKYPSAPFSGEVSFLARRMPVNGLSGAGAELLITGNYQNGKPHGVFTLIRQEESRTLSSDLTFGYQNFKSGTFTNGIEFKEAKVLRRSQAPLVRFDIMAVNKTKSGWHYRLYTQGLLSSEFSLNSKRELHGFFIENSKGNTCAVKTCLQNGLPVASQAECGES